jgi:nitroreductase
MKKSLCTILKLGCVVLMGADIALPAPQKSGGMALTDALNTRRSVRRYTKKAVTLQELSNILWSANGITRPDGKRTAPSSRNKQEILLYVTMAEGTYFFDPARNMLKQISKEDLREYSGAFDAPCYIILVGDTQKQNLEFCIAIDAGYVSQNIYLSATAQKLGTCAMRMIVDRKVLQEKMALGKNLLVLVHPIGTPAK